MNQSKEIIWIDAARAFMAFIVTIAHALSDAPVSDGMQRVVYNLLIPCVPCFYFISGYLSYRSLRTISDQTYKSRVVKQFRCYVIPAIVFLIIAFPNEETFRHLMYLNFSANYFLWTLFVANVIVGGVLLMASRFTERTKLLILALLILACCAFCHYVTAEMCPALNLKVCIWGVIFLTLGYYAAHWRGRFLAMLAHKATTASLLALWLVCIYLMENSGIPLLGNVLFRLGTPCVGILAYISVFINLQPAITRSALMTRLTVYAGRRSLAAYVVQWIFLALLWNFASPLPTGDLGYFALSVFIYIASMATYDALFAWPRLGLALFGRAKS